VRITVQFTTFAAAALLLGGCVSPGPMDVSLKYAPEPAPEAVADTPRPARHGPACAVFLAEVHDVRDDKSNLGSLGAIPVESRDTEGWIAGAIKASAADPDISFVEAAPAGGSGLTLNASLLKAYVSTQNMAKTATVVLKVRFRRGDSDLGEVFYRGNSGGIYWGVGNGEMAEALNSALRDALKSLPQDIGARCRAARVGA
jgi:hypothetical protein